VVGRVRTENCEILPRIREGARSLLIVIDKTPRSRESISGLGVSFKISQVNDWSEISPNLA
jgi:hypothetical protein